MYGDKVRVVWKHFPLDFHPDAPLAALAGAAAYEQGRFWEFHDKIFGNQPKIQRDFLLQYAREVGLDMKRFQDALNTARGKAAIDADKNEGKALGVTGTPAFFVNGRFLSGAQPFDAFAQAINAELARLNLPVPAAVGAPPPAAGRAPAATPAPGGRN